MNTKMVKDTTFTKERSQVTKKGYVMSKEGKYDDILLNILNEEGQIYPFLDVIFGFLRRRTDFYIVKNNPSMKIGFPPRIAEQIVRDVFNKWEHPYTNHMSSVQEDMTDLVIHEEEVVTAEESKQDYSVLARLQEVSNQEGLQPTQLQQVEQPNRDSDISSDTYNGVDCGKYCWSQTIREVDVKVPVTDEICSRLNVRVDIQASRLKVSVRSSSEGEWSTLLDGELNYRHHVDESIWTLIPHSHVSVYLEKTEEKWWDCLLSSETRLDLTKLNVCRNLSDLPDEDHMQVERVMVKEECRMKGLPSADHQDTLEKLRKAWNVEGSPFKGTPFDPSVLQLPY